MKLIVGLGNPGEKYVKTRHNIGFEVLDALAVEYNVNISKEKYKALFAQQVVDADLKILLIKPQTYMNLSGMAVKRFVDFYKIDIYRDLLIVYDDLDLSFGSIRLRRKGSSGGHNGIKSLIQELGTNQFCRLRIGIDKPPVRQVAADYVLGKFSHIEQTKLPEVIDLSKSVVECWIEHGMTRAMQEFN